MRLSMNEVSSGAKALEAAVGLKIAHARGPWTSGSSCDYCLLLHDCILILAYSRPTRLTRPTRPVQSISLDGSCHLCCWFDHSHSPFDNPSCPLLVSTSTFDDGDRASRSTLRSFAGNLSPTAHTTRFSPDILYLTEDSLYTLFRDKFSYSSTSSALHTARQQQFLKRWNA
jgi:hypothetical protein